MIRYGAKRPSDPGLKYSDLAVGEFFVSLDPGSELRLKIYGGYVNLRCMGYFKAGSPDAGIAPDTPVEIIPFEGVEVIR